MLVVKNIKCNSSATVLVNLIVINLAIIQFMVNVNIWFPGLEQTL